MLFTKRTLVALAVSQSIFASQIVGAEEAIEDVENLTIYGQKIERTLQETKESVAVVSAQTIDDLVLLDLEDAYLAAANVFTLSNGENFGIRGITQNSASTGGGNGELANFFIDGVAFTGFSTRFGPRDLWDVQQIEILRGPQSTNVGRNALVGAVVIETKDPDLSGFEAAVRGELANFGTYSAEGMVNFALSEDSALRLVGEHYSSDGYIDNVTLGTDDYDPDKNTLFRGKYLYQPSDELSALFTVQYAEKEIGWDGYRYDLVPIDSYQTSSNLVSFEEYEGINSSLDINYKINENWSFRSITAYIDGDYERFNDDDGGPEGGQAFRGRIAEDTNWSQELRFNYDGDEFRGTFGVFYTDIELINDTTGIVSLQPGALGVPGVLLPFYPETIFVDVLIPSETQTKNLAFFTEWEYFLTEKTTLSAGFRYDREDLDTLTNSRNSLAPGMTLPDPVQSGQVAEQLGFDEATVQLIVGGITQTNAALGALLAPSDNDVLSTSYNAFLPELGITHELNNDVMLAAFYKRGYRAGGVDVNTLGNISEFEAEFLDNFEVSLRSVHLDGDLVFNANAYYGIWTDQQLTIFENNNPFDTRVVNAGESLIYGAEFELQYQVTPQTNIYASLGIAKTEFEEFCLLDDLPVTNECDAGDGAIGQDLSGNDFALSPDLTWSVGGRHYFNDNWFMAGNVTHQGRAFSDVRNNNQIDADGTDRLWENDGFTLVNMSAGYIDGDFEVNVYVRNLFDEFYTNFLGPGIGTGNERLVNPGVPRQFGVLVSQRF